MIHWSPLTSASTLARHCAPGVLAQPGCQYSLSRWTSGRPVLRASVRAKVVLPAPGMPMMSTRRMDERSGDTSALLRQPRGPEAGEVVAGVVGGARQGARRHHQEALGVGDGLVLLERLGGDERFHLGMLARGLQVLA